MSPDKLTERRGRGIRVADKGLRVTDTELAVLDVLWTRGTATIREIAETVYRDSSPAVYATVQKLLERLEKKECVVRDRESFAHVFRANVARSDLIGQELESLAQKLCGGSLTPLLVHLVESTKLTERERKMLRRLVDETK